MSKTLEKHYTVRKTKNKTKWNCIYDREKTQHSAIKDHKMPCDNI